MYGSTACPSADTYNNLASQYRDKMWATPIFTEARVAYEKKANEYQKLADTAAKTCSQSGGGKKKKGGFSPSTPADVEAALTPPPAAGLSGTSIAIAVGGLLLLGGAAIILTRRK